MATMKVKSTDPKTQGPFVLIEASEFDPKKHVEYAPEKAPAKPAASAKAEK